MNSYDEFQCIPDLIELPYFPCVQDPSLDRFSSSKRGGPILGTKD